MSRRENYPPTLACNSKSPENRTYPRSVRQNRNVPYTLAHLAVVKPIQRLTGIQTTTSALVWGSLAPDLPMVFGFDQLSIACHHKAWGLLGVAPTAAVAGYLAWRDLAPRSARSLGLNLGALGPNQSDDVTYDEQQAKAKTSTSNACASYKPDQLSDAAKWWLTATAAAMLHVGMDAFTHEDGQAACLMPVLQQEVRGHSVAMWAQVGSSAVGLAMLYKHVKQIHPEQSWQQSLSQQREAWILTLSTAAVAGIVRTIAAPANVRCREPKKRWALGGIVGSMTAIAAIPIAAGLYDRYRQAQPGTNSGDQHADPEAEPTGSSATRVHAQHLPGPQPRHSAKHRARNNRPRFIRQKRATSHRGAKHAKR